MGPASWGERVPFQILDPLRVPETTLSRGELWSVPFPEEVTVTEAAGF